MKKIINWTFGGFFRTLGRFLVYLLLFTLLVLVFSKSSPKIPFNRLFGVIDVKADVINFSNARFQNYFIDKSDLDVTQFPSKGSGYLNLGTSYTSPSPYNYWSRTDLLFDVTTRSNSIYRGSVYFDFNNSNVTNTDISDYTLYIEGSTSTNTSGLNNNFISNVSFEFKKVSNATNRMVLIFNFTSTSQLKLVWVSIRTSANSYISGSDFNVNLIKVHNLDIEEFLDDTTGAIENNTSVIGGKLDDVNDNLNNVNDSINDINNSITDDSLPDTESSIDSWKSKLIENPLVDVITLPLTVLNSINTALSGQCSPLNITVPFINYKVQIPCISTIFSEIEGATGFWNTCGTIASALILYQYLVYLYNWIDNVINLRGNKLKGWGSV